MDSATALEVVNTSLRFSDIDRGFLELQTNQHLDMMVQDIADLNKLATKKRSVIIEIIAHPSKSRRDFQITYKVTLKPSSHIERDSQTIFMAKNSEGKWIAKPYVINQPELPGVTIDEDDAAAGRGPN